MFGREPDIAYCVARAGIRGLTAIVARPQMGKTWLLQELAYRLSNDMDYIVGATEAIGQTSDLFLRATIDLYQRWLSDSSYLEQAKMFIQQNRGRLLSGTAKMLADVVEELGDGVGKAVGKILGKGITTLIESNRKLETSGIELPALSFEQAHDLISLVTRISSKRTALILDAWDRVSSIITEAEILNAFLKDLDNWPPCHVFVALRPEDEALQTIQQITRSIQGPAEVYLLKEMHLGDLDERNRLTSFLKAEVPAAANVDDETLLKLVDGNPGVVYRWARAAGYHRSNMKSLADLESVARDAHDYRFDEVKRILPQLQGDFRTLAIRISLVLTSA